MKTLEDALSVAGEIEPDYYQSTFGTPFIHAEYDDEVGFLVYFDETRDDCGFTASELRRIADRLDPQPDSSPVIPEGWRLVPVDANALPEEQAVKVFEAEQHFRNGGCEFETLLAKLPTIPLRTEAEVRAQARREALEEAIHAIPAGWDAGNGSGTRVITPDEAIAAIRALIEKEPRNGDAP